MAVSIIVAAAENGVIGKSGKLPWDIHEYPKDLLNFRELTLNKTVIMGRQTFESIMEIRNGRPLSHRNHVVLSRNPHYHVGEGITLCPNLESAVDSALRGGSDAYIIGGGQVFSQALALKQVGSIYLTEIHKPYEGDVFFPPIENSEWFEHSRRPLGCLDFVIYGRRLHRNY